MLSAKGFQLLNGSRYTLCAAHKSLVHRAAVRTLFSCVAYKASAVAAFYFHKPLPLPLRGFDRYLLLTVLTGA